MTPEAKVKRKVNEVLDAYGAYHFSYVVTGWGASKGVPDIIACYRGRFIGIECKATSKDRPTPLQLKNLRGIKEMNGVALIIHADNINLLVRTLEIIRSRYESKKNTL